MRVIESVSADLSSDTGGLAEICAVNPICNIPKRHRPFNFLTGLCDLCLKDVRKHVGAELDQDLIHPLLCMKRVRIHIGRGGMVGIYSRDVG